MLNASPIAYSLFADEYARTCETRSRPWGDLVCLALQPPEYPSKPAMPLIKLATFGDARTPKGSLRNNSNMVRIFGVEGDYDAGIVSIEEAERRLIAAGVEAVIYSTPSHTHDAPRWRVLAPLAEHCEPGARRVSVGLLNAALGGILANESFTDSQCFYFGKVAGVPYDARHVKGSCIDTMNLFFDPVFPANVSAERPERDDFARMATLADISDETMSDLRSAVRALDPRRAAPGSYLLWVGVLQPLKSLDQAGRGAEALALAHEFSARGSGYVAAEVDKKWAQLDPHTVTYKTLFALAADDGWVNPRKLPDGDDIALADVRISRMLADMLAEKNYLFEHGGRGWLRFQAGVHVPCGKGEAMEEAKQLGGRIMRECSTSEKHDSDKVARLMKLALRAMSAAGIGAALSLSQSDPRLAVSPDEFDTDPKVLNVLNGLVDTVTGQLRPHDPQSRSSRQCTAPYDSTARAPLWEKFILDVSCDDPEWVDFVQRALGYTLTGEVSEEMMFFMIGVGANGKSVFANVVRRILGRYATTVTANFLSQSKRDGEAATPSLATLPGVRMALANEIEAGSKLSAQMVKVATSTEQIAARHNYGSVFNFVPTHKPWVRGNHRPIVSDTDEGIWRRLVLILFERHFAAHERDGQLEEKLMGEAPGILAWMVRGCMEYRRRGLRPTGRIAQASAAYRQESDILGQWIEDEADIRAGFSAVQGLAYDSYRGWCVSQGLHPVAKKSFTRGLVERGIKEGQQTTGARARLYRGIGLKGFHSAQDEQDLGLFSQTPA